MKTQDRSPRCKAHPHYRHLKPILVELGKIEAPGLKAALIFEDDEDIVFVPRPCLVVTTLNGNPHSLRDTLWWANVSDRCLLVQGCELPLTEKGRRRAIESAREELA